MQDFTPNLDKKISFNDKDLIKFSSYKGEGNGAGSTPFFPERVSWQELKSQLSSSLGYTRYEAIVTQTSTNAPEPTELLNETGAVLTWTREAPGGYLLTSSIPIFADDKLAFISGAPNSFAPSYIVTDVNSTTELSVRTVGHITGFQGDDLLKDNFIEVRIYP